jgi:hypothetical protein
MTVEDKPTDPALDLEELDGLLSNYMARALDAVPPPLEDRLNARVVMPTPEQLAVRLVPLHTLELLREAESDHNRVAAVMWASVGSLIGLVTNAAFADGRPSPWALALAAVLLTASLSSAYLTRVTGRRVTRRRAELFGGSNV